MKRKTKLIVNPVKVTYITTQNYLFLIVFFPLKNGYRIYVDIMTREKLLTWNSFIGQFVHPVGGEGMG